MQREACNTAAGTHLNLYSQHLRINSRQMFQTQREHNEARSEFLTFLIQSIRFPFVRATRHKWVTLWRSNIPETNNSLPVGYSKLPFSSIFFFSFLFFLLFFSFLFRVTTVHRLAERWFSIYYKRVWKKKKPWWNTQPDDRAAAKLQFNLPPILANTLSETKTFPFSFVCSIP